MTSRTRPQLGLILFCTRLPLPDPGPVGSGDLSRAPAGPYRSPASPWVGIGALCLLPDLGISGSGCRRCRRRRWRLRRRCRDRLPARGRPGRHGGWFRRRRTRERKLEIMRDSRVGTYGACAPSLMLRGRRRRLADPAQVAAALNAAHLRPGACRRSCCSSRRRARRPCRRGRPAAAPERHRRRVFAWIALGLRPWSGSAATIVSLLLLLRGIGFSWPGCARKQIGGQTGDVLGALEQTGEMTILLVAGGECRRMMLTLSVRHSGFAGTRSQACSGCVALACGWPARPE